MKASLLFWLHPQRRRNLYARITCAGQRTEISMGYAVDPRSWDQRQQRIVSGPLQGVVNTAITELQLRFYKAVEQPHISASIIRDAITGSTRVVVDTSPDIIAAFDAYVETQSLSRNTRNIYTAVRTHLSAYNVRLHNINNAWAQGFANYLSTAVGLDASTIDTYMAKIRSAAAFALHHFSRSDYPLLPDRVAFAYRVSRKAKPQTHKYLTLAQVQHLQDIELDSAGAYYRRALQVQFLTGMAYTDLKNLRDPEIIHTISGGQRFRYVRGKTGKECLVPVTPAAAAFIMDFDSSRMPSDVTYNKGLQRIGELLGLPKLTSHYGRHTFGVLKLIEGYSMESIRQMMGHDSVRTTERIYARVSADKIAVEEINSRYLGIF